MKTILSALNFLDKLAITSVLLLWLYLSVVERSYLGIVVWLLGLVLVFYLFFKHYRRKPLGTKAVDITLIVALIMSFNNPELSWIELGVILAPVVIDLLFCICLGSGNVEGFSKK